MFKRWTGSGYRDIRRAQNGSGATVYAPQEEVLEYANALEDYIEANEKISSTVMTYRGVTLPTTLASQLQKGGTFDVGYSALSSWTTDKAVAANFAGTSGYGDTAVVFACKGQSRGVDISAYSYMPEEKEVLVSSKSNSYTITSVKKQRNGSLYVTVKET